MTKNEETTITTSTPIPKPPPAPWKDFVSGVVGGASLVCAGHPLDTLKVRMQTMPKPLPGQPPLYTNALDCFYKTVKVDGFLGLYKGMSSPLTGVPPLYAIVFGAYGWAKSLFTKPVGSDVLTVNQIFWAGCVTGVSTTFITTPIELVKARLQIQSGANKQYSGLFDCGSKIFKAEGLRGLNRGFVATLWRDVPGSGAYFATYELVKRSFIPEGGSAADLKSWQLLLAGGSAGVANWLTVFPIDVVKSVIQTDMNNTYAAGHRGMLQCAKSIVANNGIAGLFRGIGPALLRSFPANAACFLAVEKTMQLLNRTF